MRTLILDTIHGGQTIANYIREFGDTVDTVDVYRDDGTISLLDAQNGISHAKYDKVIHPVHLQTGNLLLQEARKHNIPTQTHHEAVAEILSEWEQNGTFVRPRRMVEITGARGKTTTAYALASCLSLSGPGLLHSSAGIYTYPNVEKVGSLSITPASILTIARDYWKHGMTWMICEESLGVSGYNDCAILTSDVDYRCAASTCSALEIKKTSLINSPCVLTPGKNKQPEIQMSIPVDTIVQTDGEWAEYQYGAWEGTCTNPLFFLSQYRTSLALATAASVLLGVEPRGINSFQAVQGRLSITTQTDNACNERVVLDDSNSGTTHQTAIEAARYLRSIAHTSDIILCIGQDAHAVCENLTASAIIEAIRVIKPAYTILVASGLSESEQKEISAYLDHNQYPYQNTPSLETVQQILKETSSIPSDIPVLLAVKTWR